MKRVTRRWIAASFVCVLLGGIAGLRAVPEPGNSFHFSIIGDRTGGATPQVYGRVWREVDLLHPDFVVNVGDTIEGGDDRRAEQDWAALRPIWVRYSQYPLYFTPGNHDVFSEGSRKLFEKETKRPSSYSFNYQDAHFTVLDNSGSDELPESQLEFLRRDLEQNKDKSPKFILFHRPFWIPYVIFKSGAFPLHQIAKKYGVSYVICGHMHQFMRMTHDGIVYMVVGSSGASIKRGLNAGQGFQQGWFYHHAWVQVKGSKVSVTVKEIDGGLGKGRMFKAEDWGDYGPKFDISDPASSEKPPT
jgi:predicted phosphodiesterase